MSTPDVEHVVLQEMLSVLAKILANGLSSEQRSTVLRGCQLGLAASQTADENLVFRALQRLKSSSPSLEYVLDLLRRIEGTRSFYQDVGPELDRLRYLTTKHILVKRQKQRPLYVFVLLPFMPDFFKVFEKVIKPSLQELGCLAEHAKDIASVDNLIDVIFSQISKADYLVADTTGGNPNVFYEIGFAHALGKKVLLLTQDTTRIPFDIGGLKHLHYSPDSPDALSLELKRHAEVICKELTGS